MEVIKRNGSKETVKLDKIAARIKKQTWGLNTKFVDYMEIVQKTISGRRNGSKLLIKPSRLLILSFTNSYY